MTNHGPHGAARRLVLTVSCPDRSGIVAAITGFIASHGGWVAEAAQHSDLTTGRFFQRIEVLADSLPFGPEEFGERFAGVAEAFRLDFQVRDSGVPKRIVLLASREDHCLADVLHRWRRGDLRCEIPLVVSNHPDLEALVDWYGIGFRHVPVGAERKEEAFDAIAALVDGAGADLVVLARYMQILPASFCARYPERIVNIHHSFLPSFVGARPYHQAFERGVKLIGATCHYVTPELDAGPIIEQDTARIDHADSVQDLLRIGRDIERAVLARALRWLLEDRVLLNGARTVVFA